MPDEIRLDAAGKLGKSEPTAQGGAVIPASLTRAGIIQYRDPSCPGGMRREWRPSKEVFREDSIRAIESLPVIVGHSAWVTPNNYTQVSRGVVDARSTSRRDAFLDGKVRVQDADALRRCDSGELTDLSLGYALKYVPGAGVVPEGEPDAGQRYDGIQTNLVANHLALLPPGTSRADVGFRFDSQDDPLAGAPVLIAEPYAPETPAPTLEKPMALMIRLDAKDYDVSKPEEAVALQHATDKIRQDANEANARALRAEGTVDGLKTTILTLETAAKDTTRLDSLVESRVILEGNAKKVLGDKYDCRGKKDREIQIDVIRLDAKDFTGLGAEGKSASGAPREDLYVQARFDSVIEHSIPAGSIHDLRRNVNPDRLPERPERREDRRDAPVMSASERARIANDEASRTAWQRR